MITKKDFRDFVTHDSYEVEKTYISTYTYKRWNLSILAECKAFEGKSEGEYLATVIINDNSRTIKDDRRTYWDFDGFAYWLLEWLARWISVDTLLKYRKDWKWKNKEDELNTYESREDRQDFEEKEKEEI